MLFYIIAHVFPELSKRPKLEIDVVPWISSNLITKPKSADSKNKPAAREPEIEITASVIPSNMTAHRLLLEGSDKKSKLLFNYPYEIEIITNVIPSNMTAHRLLLQDSDKKNKPLFKYP